MHSSALLRSSSITGAARLNDAVKLVMEKQIGSVQSDSAPPKVLMSAKKNIHRHLGLWQTLINIFHYRS